MEVPGIDSSSFVISSPRSTSSVHTGNSVLDTFKTALGSWKSSTNYAWTAVSLELIEELYKTKAKEYLPNLDDEYNLVCIIAVVEEIEIDQLVRISGRKDLQEQAGVAWCKITTEDNHHLYERDRLRKEGDPSFANETYSSIMDLEVVVVLNHKEFVIKSKSGQVFRESDKLLAPLNMHKLAPEVVIPHTIDKEKVVHLRCPEHADSLKKSLTESYNKQHFSVKSSVTLVDLEGKTVTLEPGFTLHGRLTQKGHVRRGYWEQKHNIKLPLGSKDKYLCEGVGENARFLQLQDDDIIEGYCWGLKTKITFQHQSGISVRGYGTTELGDFEINGTGSRGGSFHLTAENKNGKFGFDFWWNDIEKNYYGRTKGDAWGVGYRDGEECSFKVLSRIEAFVDELWNNGQEPVVLVFRKGRSFAETTGLRHIKEFVSHNWGEPAWDFLKSLRKAHVTSAWICVLALDQHRVPELNDLTSLPFYRALTSLPRRGRMVMVLDRSAVALQRFWCVFECWVCYDKGLRLELFTPDGEVNFFEGRSEKERALKQVLQDLDLKDAKCTVKADKDMIVKHIEKNGGMEQVNSEVKRKLSIGASLFLRSLLCDTFLSFFAAPMFYAFSRTMAPMRIHGSYRFGRCMGAIAVLAGMTPLVSKWMKIFCGIITIEGTCKSVKELVKFRNKFFLMVIVFTVLEMVASITILVLWIASLKDHGSTSSRYWIIDTLCENEKLAYWLAIFFTLYAFLTITPWIILRLPWLGVRLRSGVSFKDWRRTEPSSGQRLTLISLAIIHWKDFEVGHPELALCYVDSTVSFIHLPWAGSEMWHVLLFSLMAWTFAMGFKMIHTPLTWLARRYPWCATIRGIPAAALLGDLFFIAIVLIGAAAIDYTFQAVSALVVVLLEKIGPVRQCWRCCRYYSEKSRRGVSREVELREVSTRDSSL